MLRSVLQGLHRAAAGAACAQPHPPLCAESDTLVHAWEVESVETQVLQAALQDVPTGNVKPVYQLCKSKPEAHIQSSHEEPAPQGTGVRQ